MVIENNVSVKSRLNEQVKEDLDSLYANKEDTKQHYGNMIESFVDFLGLLIYWCTYLHIMVLVALFTIVSRTSLFHLSDSNLNKLLGQEFCNFLELPQINSLKIDGIF